MRKIVICLLVLTLGFSSLVGNTNNAFALANSKDEIHKVERTIDGIKANDNKQQYDVDVKETLGMNDEKLNMTVIEGFEGEMLVESRLESGNILITSDLYINLNNGDFFVTEKIISDSGEELDKVYDITVTEIEGDSFKAHLIDRQTGETYDINTIDATSSALPVIAALVVRAGLQYVIKHYGKKVAMQAMIDVAVSQITKAYGGTVKNAKNGKGKVITIPNKKQEIVIRLMEAGSGGRKDAYWRMSVGNKALNRAGNYSNNAAETHITLQESSPSTIINLIKKFKK